MCPTETGTLMKLGFEMERLYRLLSAQIANAGVVPGEDLPDGFNHTDEFGEDLLRSPFDPEKYAAFVVQVTSFWKSSGKLPSVEDLSSWQESLDVSLAESICTLWCLVMTAGFPLLIASGGADTALHTARSIGETLEQKTTVPNISQKTGKTSENGASSASPSVGRKHGTKSGKGRQRSRKKNPNGLRNPDAPASNSIRPLNLQESDDKSSKKRLKRNQKSTKK